MPLASERKRARELNASARASAFINTSFHRAANPITQKFIQRACAVPPTLPLVYRSCRARRERVRVANAEKKKTGVRKIAIADF